MAQQVKEKLQAIVAAETTLLQAKVDYIHATMQSMIDDQPIDQLADDCKDFIEDTYHAALRINDDQYNV